MALIRPDLGRTFRAVETATETGKAALPSSGGSTALRTSRLAALRETLAQIAPAQITLGATPSHEESAAPLRSAGDGAPLAFGIGEIDRSLPGAGLAIGAVHEIVAKSHADRPAALGFALALMAKALQQRSGPAVIVVSGAAERDFGCLYAPGLRQIGIDPGRLLRIAVRSDRDALWAIEETLRSGAGLAMVLGLVGSGARAAGKNAASGKKAALSDLTVSRRLSLAAAHSGTPLLLALPQTAGVTTAAATRWRVASASEPPPEAAQHPRDPLPAARPRREIAPREIRHTRWQAGLERCRNGRTGEWCIEWDHAALRFSLPRELAHAAPRRRFG